MVLTKTKVDVQSYCHIRLGYYVLCSSSITTDSVRYQWGVVLIFQYRPKGWSVELMRFHGMNVVGCKIIVGGKRKPLIGVYLPPSTLEHLLDL